MVAGYWHGRCRSRIDALRLFAAHTSGDLTAQLLNREKLQRRGRKGRKGRKGRQQPHGGARKPPVAVTTAMPFAFPGGACCRRGSSRRSRPLRTSAGMAARRPVDGAPDDLHQTCGENGPEKERDGPAPSASLSSTVPLGLPRLFPVRRLEHRVSRLAEHTAEVLPGYTAVVGEEDVHGGRQVREAVRVVRRGASLEHRPAGAIGE
jgi:hypothetical protein